MDQTQYTTKFNVFFFVAFNLIMQVSCLLFGIVVVNFDHNRKMFSLYF